VQPILVNRRALVPQPFIEVFDDYASRDLFEELMHDEEEHIDFLETQLDLVAKLGLELYAQYGLFRQDELASRCHLQTIILPFVANDHQSIAAEKFTTGNRSGFAGRPGGCRFIIVTRLARHRISPPSKIIIISTIINARPHRDLAPPWGKLSTDMFFTYSNSKLAISMRHRRLRDGSSPGTRVPRMWALLEAPTIRRSYPCRRFATIGFDIAKSVFQVHGVDAGRVSGCPPSAEASSSPGVFRVASALPH
jgi:hypothetical protein